MQARSQSKKDIHGILLLDKPIGLTSNAALQKVKWLYQARKAGHTGSLDPLASGMLPICFGEATKFCQFLLDADKWYRVTAKLGIKTNTGDAEGEVISQQANVNISGAQIAAVLPSFHGIVAQIPPMYSALKHQGQPLYQLARQGKEVVREPRNITIYTIKLIELLADSVTLEVHCSKGTYIRTLVEDIGDKLGCGAHVTELRRFQIGSYQYEQMLTIEDLNALAIHTPLQLTAKLLPLETAVMQLPPLNLTEQAIEALRFGQVVQLTQYSHSGLVRLITNTQQFLGIGEILDNGKLISRRLLSS